MQQRRGKDADGRCLEGEEARHAKVTPKPQRASHVDEPGLEEALQPAGALVEPIAKRDIGLLTGRCGDHAAAIAMPRQAETEIGILSDIVGVPAAHSLQSRGAEVIGRAAERERTGQGRQHRQLKIEQHGIFDGELAAEPVLMGIVEGKPGLEAGDLRPARGEDVGGQAKLTGLGDVLGIVHGKQAAAGECQGIVQRLGLGQRQGRRHDDDLEPRRKPASRQGVAGSRDPQPRPRA